MGWKGEEGGGGSGGGAKEHWGGDVSRLNKESGGWDPGRGSKMVGCQGRIREEEWPPAPGSENDLKTSCLNVFAVFCCRPLM